MKPSRATLLTAAAGVAALWLLPAAAQDATGAMPCDDALTCQQLASEIAPYARQMAVAPLNQTTTELMARNQARMAAEVPTAAALSAAAIASSADPTGASQKAVGQIEPAHQRELFTRPMVEDEPLADKANAQANQVAAQAQQLQSNARLQRLMQLGQQKHSY